MTSHQLTPAQALWQHYNIAPATENNPQPQSLARTNPVQHKELFNRLQQMGRITSRTQSLANLISPHGRVQVDGKIGDNVACFPQSKCWTIIKRDTEDDMLGLSEL